VLCTMLGEESEDFPDRRWKPLYASQVSRIVSGLRIFTFHCVPTRTYRPLQESKILETEHLRLVRIVCEDAISFRLESVNMKLWQYDKFEESLIK